MRPAKVAASGSGLAGDVRLHLRPPFFLLPQFENGMEEVENERLERRIHSS